MSDFFTTKFNFERYIEDRLLEVSDENERRALKEVIKATLIPFYKETEQAYHELAEKLEYTRQMEKGRFQILTGIQEKRRVDVTDEAMSVMDPDDLNPFEVDTEEMLDSIHDKRPYPVMRVYVMEQYEALRKMILMRRKWKGVIYTENGEYQAVFQLRQNQSYYQKITDLYKWFEDNNIPWRTVCAPYLSKFFDIDIVETDCSQDEVITKVKVDFEELTDKVLYDIVPMWNIRIVEERSSAFPDFAIDQIHYEHLIFKEKLKDPCDYLLCQTDMKLWEIYRRNQDLHIICDINSPTKFTLLEFHYEALEKENDAIVFFNESLAKASNRILHTKADIKRFLGGLGYEDWFALTEVKCMKENYLEKGQTYSLNTFLEDEIRSSEKREVLVFVFNALKPENFLNQDILSYLISSIQWQIPEYECVGVYQ